jgi:hypothetical protein
LKYRHKRKEGRIVKLDVKFAPVIVFCSKRWLARRHSPAERRAPGPRHAKTVGRAKTRRDAETVPISLSPQRTTHGAPSSAQFVLHQRRCSALKLRRATHSTRCQNESIHLCFAKRPRLAQWFVKAARDLCCFWRETFIDCYGRRRGKNKNDGIFPPGHEAFLSEACTI